MTLLITQHPKHHTNVNVKHKFQIRDYANNKTWWKPRNKDYGKDYAYVDKMITEESLDILYFTDLRISLEEI